MRLRLEGNETRDELLETLSHVGATHQSSTNPHMRKILIDEADELLDAVAFIDQFEAIANG